MTNRTITPVDAGLDEIRAVLRPKFESREHWFLVCDLQASRLIGQIADRYYREAGNDSFELVTAFWQGQVFHVCAARKSRMLAYQLVSLLRQCTSLRLTEREILSRDLLVIAEMPLLSAGTALSAAILDGPMMERPPLPASQTTQNFTENFL